MKRLKKQNKTKLALCAGAAALAALVPQTHAQSSDALIDKLEAKGILTADEAKDLRAESDKDFKTALQAKTGMPDWVNAWKIYGDFRGRYDQENATDNSTATDRMRWRYRLRFGITASLIDNMEVGFRLATDDNATGGGSSTSQGNPVSGTSTFQNNGTKKGIWVDTAYAKWTAINSGDWLLAATIGKMDNPFGFTPMVFDYDYTPEGAALTTTYNINDENSVTVTGGAFVLDEEALTTQDPYLYGGQVTLNSKWSKKWSTSIGGGILQISNPQQLTVGNVPFQNQGNTYNTGGVLLYHYNPIIGDASVTYKMESFPFYPGECPIKVGGEIMDNTAVNQNHMGYWLGATLGKAGAKHTWDMSYRYEWLEADAWYAQLVDDDAYAYYQNPGTGSLNGTAPNPGGRGFYGGTNIRGHQVRFNYAITDYLMFTMTGYLTDLINANNQQSPAASNVAEPNSTAVHFMADLNWKF
jgi:hypothetical protein